MSKNQIKVAAILDKFSYDCFKYECNLIEINPDNFQQIILEGKPDLLLVESAWEGNNGKWRYKVGNLHIRSDSSLKNVVDLCKKFNIPTVFWNKEDPSDFDYFISTAKLFDYVFTTDENSISRYKEILEHDKIYSLPFAAQPNIHNPINKDKERLGKVAFAGSWYSKHLDRKKNMEVILKPALQYGLHIYDRHNNYSMSNNYKFPDIYSPFIKGCVPYDEMVKIYKKYDVFLNVNTINNSTTMFSRRVFELLACGVNVISSYSVGIEKMFHNIVKLCSTEDETRKYLDILLNNKEMRDRISLLGQREVLNNHTYNHRFKKILDTVGLNCKSNDNSGVSIITCTNRTDCMDNVFANFQRQSYEEKELIIILNNDSMNLKAWNKRAKLNKNIKVFQLDEKKSLGECLNFGVNQAKFESIAKFDDDDYYAPHYLTDAMNAFKYTDADIVGKHSYYAYLNDEYALAVRFPNMENRYANFLCGATMVIRKNVFNTVRFSEKSIGEDTDFLKNCIERSIKLYSIDRFNYVCIRYSSSHSHTWKIENDEFLRKCQLVGYFDDYLSNVTL